MDKISVHLLGRPYVEANGKRVNFPYKKAEGFFYYLCVKKNAAREEIIYVLWGADNENVGRKNLREAVYQIKKLLGKEILVTEGHTQIALNPECAVQIDWDNVGEADLLAHEQEGFLAHFHIKNCYEFEEWIASMQEQYDRRIMKTVKKKLNEADTHKDMAQIQKYGNMLIRQDPYNEALYHEIMELYAAGGNYNMAIKLYYDLEKILSEDLGVEPSGEITRLFHRIFNVKGNVTQPGGSWNVSFTGRTEEIYRISQCVNGAGPSGIPQCVAIVGEEGVGKTALLNKAAQMLKGYKRFILWANCYREEKEFYLRPWYDIFREMEQCAENGMFDQELIREEKWQIHQLIQGVSEMEKSKRVQPALQSVERIVLEMCRKITKSCKLVFFFDDIQWMDAMSFQLLNRLLLTVGTDKILAVCAYDQNCDREIMEALERLIRQDLLCIVSLEPFTKQETWELLHRFLPQLDGEEKKREQIYEMTDGNAFFLMEMINYMKEKGFTLEIAPKIHNVIKARLGGLPEIENRVLDCMSVFPEKTAIEDLELLLPDMDRLTLIRVLEKLQERHLIKESLIGWNIFYEFFHRVFREYIYERQSQGQRRLYHQMLAEYYENQGKMNFARLPMIIYHYEKCHNRAKVYEYKIAYFSEYYTLVNENFPILHWEMEEDEEESFLMTGAPQIMELAEEVIRLSDSSPKVREMKMKMYYVKGRYNIAQGEYGAGLSSIEQSIFLARELKNKKTLLNSYKQICFYGIQVEKPDLVKEYLDRGFLLLKEEDKEDRGVFTRLLGWYYLYQKEYKKAEETFRRAIEIFQIPETEERIFHISIAACYGYLGDLYREQGKLDQAAEYYEKALETGNDQVITNGLGQFYSGLGQVRLLQGNYEEGEKYLLQAVECLKRYGYYWGREKAEAYLAMLLLKEGRKEEGRSYYEESRRISEKIKNPSTERLLQEIEKDFL